jgi:thymidylate kinase
VTIIALEGADCCGKSTAFENLKIIGYPVLDQPKCSRELFHSITELERRELSLWEALYDGRDIVCDRSVFVSGPVYAMFYGREVLTYRNEWLSKLFVVYFDVPTELLERRYAERGDDKFEGKDFNKLKLLYELMLLPKVRHVRVRPGDSVPGVLAAAGFQRMAPSSKV